MKCANHLDKDAAAVCNHCGRSICLDCQVQVQNENYCKDCATIKMGQAKKVERSPALAAILSFVVAGLGQIYNGQIGKGLLIFFTFWLIIPWIIGIFDAYNTAKKINAGQIAVKPKPGCLIAFVIAIAVFLAGVFFLTLLAAIAIPNFIRARSVAYETSAKDNLKQIAAAIEAYRRDNNEAYPLDEKGLSRYLPKSFNNQTWQGYTFVEYLRSDGYKIVATPVKCGVTGGKIFTIKTNGALFSQSCRGEGEGR